MTIVLALLGIALVVVILWDALEAIILPRTVERKLGFSTFYFSVFDNAYRWIGERISDRSRRERILGAFAPIAVILLLSIWAFSLVLAFGLLHFALQSKMSDSMGSLGEYCYFSATTFFTLGYGDISPIRGTGRFLAVLEAGLGFGFLALLISYIPVLYQNFSRREATILLLDARAGTPPTAGRLLATQLRPGSDGLLHLLAELERWAASLLESYLSYPILAYYRSQHWQMSWLATVAVALDTCSFILASPASDKGLKRQAELTFAMCRHLLVDLAYVVNARPFPSSFDRLSEEHWKILVSRLQVADPERVRSTIDELRAKYEPFLFGLSHDLLLDIPPWVVGDDSPASWQTSAWDGDEHF